MRFSIPLEALPLATKQLQIYIVPLLIFSDHLNSTEMLSIPDDSLFLISLFEFQS